MKGEKLTLDTAIDMWRMNKTSEKKIKRVVRILAEKYYSIFYATDKKWTTVTLINGDGEIHSGGSKRCDYARNKDKENELVGFSIAFSRAVSNLI